MHTVVTSQLQLHDLPFILLSRFTRNTAPDGDLEITVFRRSNTTNLATERFDGARFSDDGTSYSPLTRLKKVNRALSSSSGIMLSGTSCSRNLDLAIGAPDLRLTTTPLLSLRLRLDFDDDIVEPSVSSLCGSTTCRCFLRGWPRESSSSTWRVLF